MRQRTSQLIMSVQGASYHMRKNKSMRANTIKMDETLFQNTLKGKLAEEGKENVFMSELGWATYLDKEGYSYAMNQKVSEADDGYFTPDAFSNPLKVIGSWMESMNRVKNDPLAAAFPTITNDPDGKRSWGEGSEFKSRTHQLDKSYPPSGDKLFNLFGMTPTETGKDNEPFFESLKEFGIDTKAISEKLPKMESKEGESGFKMPDVPKVNLPFMNKE